MSSIGKRLWDFGNLHYGSKEKFAQALEMSLQSLSRYINNKVVPGKIVKERLRALGADVDYILTGRGKEDESNSIKSQNIKQVTPIRGVIIPMIKNVYAGNSKLIFQEINIEGNILVADYNKQENVFAMKVVGDSMTEKIFEGEAVIIDLDAPVYPGDIVVASLRNGDDLVKQFIKDDENQLIILRSFNKEYPDIKLQEYDVLKLIKVVGVQPPMRRT